MLLRKFALFALISLAAVAASAQAPAKPAGPPPIEAFFDYGSVRWMDLSPNQRWLAARVVPAGGGPLQLVITDLQDKEPARVVAAFSRANVTSFYWVNDDLLVLEAADNLARGYDGDRGGLISVTRDGERMRHLSKAAWETNYGAPGIQPLEGNHSFVSLGEPGSDEIIVSAARYDRAEQTFSETLLTMNARTGARRSLLKSVPDDASGFLYTPRGQPRLAFTYRDGFSSYQWYEPASETWRQLARFKSLAAPWTPEFIDGQGRLYVSVQTAGGKGEELRHFDFQKGEPGEEAIVATPGFSGNFTPVMSREDGELLGLRLDLDADEVVWLKPEIAALQKRVDDRLKGRINRLLCSRCDRQEVVLVFSHSDRAPGDFLLYRPRTGEIQRVGSRRPAIDPAAMAPVHFERIKTRDGQDLPVYITLPAGGATKARAAVVLVHGGPNVRGRSWEWDADSQFLASRGYVVIEPEFRGSSGWGEAHLRAGFKQWGLAMQDDVSDAVAWAVKRGWVDARRVCIAGASYGGYATLVGLAKTPDAYRCGVSWIGVSDLKLLFNAHWSDTSRAAKEHSMKERVGDPEKDSALLDANSPINMADRIKAPLLLAYGGVDRRVPIEHGERMRAALRKAGQEPEWVVYPNEGHGWNYPETKKDFWQRVETFLGRHLKP